MDTLPLTGGDDVHFSEELDHWLGGDGPKTLGGLIDAFAERGFAAGTIVLMMLPALPLPTGGVTHLFELITVLLAAQMVLGRRAVWLPARWRRRELGGRTLGSAMPALVRRLRWFERWTRPRGRGLLETGAARRVVGAVLVVLAAAAAAAPPFSGLDTLPALGAVVVALGLLAGDLVFIVAGVVMGLVGIALIATLGVALFKGIGSLF